MKSRRLLTKALLSTVAACALGGEASAAEPAELRKSALDYFEVIPSMVPAV